MYYKMRHLQQTYMAFCSLQVWRISDLLNSKAFVNSSNSDHWPGLRTLSQPACAHNNQEWEATSKIKKHSKTKKDDFLSQFDYNN
jgi:hypothetical protein